MEHCIVIRYTHPESSQGGRGSCRLDAPELVAEVQAGLHGCAKATLFLIAGILLHRFGSVDEYRLAGRGRRAPAIGALFAIAALVVAGVPPSGTFVGSAAIEESARSEGSSWTLAFMAGYSVLTGAAVLRAAARIFLGWGSDEGGPSEASSAGAEDRDTEGSTERIPAVMVVPVVITLALSVLVGVPPPAAGSAGPCSAGTARSHSGPGPYFWVRAPLPGPSELLRRQFLPRSCPHEPGGSSARRTGRRSHFCDCTAATSAITSSG
jgi:hypothetical protein